jgi:hypothetical protein
MPTYRLAKEALELDSEDKEAWQYLRQDGRTKRILSLGTGNTVPCGDKEDILLNFWLTLVTTCRLILD